MVRSWQPAVMCRQEGENIWIFGVVQPLQKVRDFLWAEMGTDWQFFKELRGWHA